MNRKVKIIVFFLFVNFGVCFGQLENSGQSKQLTLNDVIHLAKEISPAVLAAKQTLRSSFLAYKNYRSSRLPGLNLTTTPFFYSHSIEKTGQDDGTYRFISTENINSRMYFSLDQNILFTGGRLSVNSGLNIYKHFSSNDQMFYSATPLLSVKYAQPLNLYNEFKWTKKIEPLRYEQARKNYISTVEDISLKAIQLFFSLSLAQLNLDIAKLNLSNADTLYKITKGRHNIGTIVENELLQMELTKLNAQFEINRAKIDLVYQKAQLNSFLGFNESVNIAVVLPGKVKTVSLDLNQVFQIALSNNPQVLEMELQVINATKELAYKHSQRKFKGDISIEFGLDGMPSSSIQNTYSATNKKQVGMVSLQIPIFDWGIRKGEYKIAEANHELVNLQVNQRKSDFEQEIYLKVMRFNLQKDQLYIALKADSVAAFRFNVTKNRFKMGKISVTDLNLAVTERDGARRAYINTLQTFYNNLYEIRKTTLYDFIRNEPIRYETDFLE